MSFSGYRWQRSSSSLSSMARPGTAFRSKGCRNVVVGRSPLNILFTPRHFHGLGVHAMNPRSVSPYSGQTPSGATASSCQGAQYTSRPCPAASHSCWPTAGVQHLISPPTDSSTSSAITPTGLPSLLKMGRQNDNRHASVSSFFSGPRRSQTPSAPYTMPVPCTDGWQSAWHAPAGIRVNFFRSFMARCK